MGSIPKKVLTEFCLSQNKVAVKTMWLHVLTGWPKGGVPL